MTTDDQRTAILHVLGLWWAADRRGMCAGMGYPSECPSTRGYRSGYRGGDADDSADELRELVSAVARAVDGLPRDQQMCAGVLARAECTGAAVWRNPRLPSGQDAIEELERATIRALVDALWREEVSA